MAKKKAKAQPVPLIPSLTPKSSTVLRIETLLEGYVWVVPKFFSEKECEDFKTFMDSTASVEYTQQRATRWMASRECYRSSQKSERASLELYQRMQLCCPRSLTLLPKQKANTCNPNIRLYKYSKGMAFGKHIDESNSIAEGVTKMTMLVYLSSCSGGATRFDAPDGKREIAYQPTVGSLLLHLHGPDCLLHQADPVISGEKYVLRSDLVYPYS